MKPEKHEHKGYVIELFAAPPMWQAGISPKDPKAEKLSKSAALLTRPTKDGVLAEARKRIDALTVK